MKTKSFFRIAAILFIAVSFYSNVIAQDETTVQEEKKVEPEKPKGYGFEIQKQIPTTRVKSQGSTGTCWSFATASFLESELQRMGRGEHDLSEMFIVRNVYRDKARNYLLRNGKANFSEGALAHDLVNALDERGIVPEQVYSGREANQRHDHGEMVAALKGMLDGLVKRPKLSKKWTHAFDGVLTAYLGNAPDEFSYQGKSYAPVEFAKEMGLSTDNYINFTSYTHHPFGKPFVLEIPDNFSNGSFQNLPIDQLVQTIDNAIENGYTVAWDGDVSERTFNMGNGIAILPKNSRGDLYTEPGEEIEVTQEMRQDTFNSKETTDDHLMHLTGIAHDKNGKKYYLIKNSWGEIGKNKGYIYMSEPYLRLKTISILVHKDAATPPAGSVEETKAESSNEATETAGGVK